MHHQQLSGLLLSVQRTHEKIVNLIGWAEKQVAQPVGETPSSIPPHLSSVLLRTRRGLHALLMEERQELRQYAVSVGLHERELPPAFEKPALRVMPHASPVSGIQASPARPLFSSPVKATADVILDPEFDLRVLRQLRQRLIDQLAPLLAQPVTLGPHQRIDDKHVIKPQFVTKAQSLQADIEKINSEIEKMTWKLHPPAKPLSSAGVLTPLSSASKPLATPLSSASQSIVPSTSSHSNPSFDPAGVEAKVDEYTHSGVEAGRPGIGPRKLTYSPMLTPAHPDRKGEQGTSQALLASIQSKLAALSTPTRPGVQTPSQATVSAVQPKASSDVATAPTQSIPFAIVQPPPVPILQPLEPAEEDAFLGRFVRKIERPSPPRVSPTAAVSIPTLVIPPSAPFTMQSPPQASPNSYRSEDSADSSSPDGSVRARVAMDMRMQKAVVEAVVNDYLSLSKSGVAARPTLLPSPRDGDDDGASVRSSELSDPSFMDDDDLESDGQDEDPAPSPPPTTAVEELNAEDALQSPPPLPRSSHRIQRSVVPLPPPSVLTDSPLRMVSRSNQPSPIIRDDAPSSLPSMDASVAFLEVESSFALTPNRHTHSGGFPPIPTSGDNKPRKHSKLAAHNGLQ